MSIVSNILFNQNENYLQIWRAVIQKLQHVLDVLCILNNEIQFHVEFASNQLKRENNTQF